MNLISGAICLSVCRLGLCQVWWVFDGWMPENLVFEFRVSFVDGTLRRGV